MKRLGYMCSMMRVMRLEDNEDNKDDKDYVEVWNMIEEPPWLSSASFSSMLIKTKCG